jgi:hypothetical protein
MQHLSSHFQHNHKSITLIISSYNIPACTLYVCLNFWIIAWLTLEWHRPNFFPTLTDFLQHVWTRLIPSSPGVWLFFLQHIWFLLLPVFDCLSTTLLLPSTPGVWLPFYNTSDSFDSRCLTDFLQHFWFLRLPVFDCIRRDANNWLSITFPVIVPSASRLWHTLNL